MRQYVTPELELVRFLATDIIMTSTGDTSTTEPGQTEQTGEDETPIG